MLYNDYSRYLRNKFGEKVYKVSVNLPLTCPNRDGNLGERGCIFCGSKGGGLGTLQSYLPIEQQVKDGIERIKKKHKAQLFIVYFQNYTNTYLPLEQLKNYLFQIPLDEVVQIAISTRPDCINEEYLEYLKTFQADRGRDIVLEFGLQTPNYHSLLKLNRGHTLAEYIDGVRRVKKYGFTVCTHLILNLPWDTMDDVIESAKLVSALGIEQVKLHSLFILPNTQLHEEYQKGNIQLISLEEYQERVITFLEYLDPNIVVQRLIGRSPEKEVVFINWGVSWLSIKQEIEEIMIRIGSYQGKKFNYLGGKALKKAGL